MTAGTTSTTAAVNSGPLAGAISVGKVSGGEPTNPMWMSKVGNKPFREALIGSLKNNGMLAAAKGRYRLDANLVTLDQPLAGFSFTVKSSVKYNLVDTNTGGKIWNDFVSASGTARFRDAMVGVDRLRIANERAIKNNIQAMIGKLGDVGKNISAAKSSKPSS